MNFVTSFHLLHSRPALVQIGCLLALLISPASINASEDVVLPPTTKSDLMAILPMNIRHLNMESPKVDFKIRISTSGEIADFVPISATHVDLVKRATKTLEKVVFEPATLNGEPIPSNSEISIYFYDPVTKTGAYINEESGMDHIEDMLFNMTRSDFEYTVSMPNELDKPLQVIERGQTAAPYDENGDVIKGTAIVEFYVDNNGVPRLLSIKKSDNIEISKAAIYTVQQLRFDEPKRNRKPTTVKAQIPITYKN